MRKHLWLAAAALTAVTATSMVATAQEPTQQKIVYGRSTGTMDRPRLNEIFIMNADGTDVVRLTHNSEEDAYPALSPDGTQIAFSRRTNGQADLYVMNVDGTNVRRLMRAPNTDEVLPSWDPNGKRLAYTAVMDIPQGWQSDIYRIRVRDGGFLRLTFTPRTKEFAPDWSPDGTRIAFTKQNEKQHRYGIATVRPDGEGLRWLVINPKSKDGYNDLNPSWSPDSQWVAFSRELGSDAFLDIYKVRRNGSGVSAVTELSQQAENPVWGTDGRIMFMHDEGIAMIPEDGGELSHLTPTRTGAPYWWPDW